MTGAIALTLQGVSVASYVRGEQMADVRSPRPHLHPVRTAAGTIVTDVEPADHPWHLGAGLAIPDVAGVNFWGGPTYVRDRGYLDLPDHGRVERRRIHSETSSLDEDLEWVRPDGQPLLKERRTIAVATAGADQSCWLLRWSSTLHNVTGRPLHIGSPATHGRSGAGYGGFFWRAPAATAQPWHVFTATADGVAAAHGNSASWLALGGSDPVGNRYTIVFVQAGFGPIRPWFVRVDEYPGVCPALAFDRPLSLPADGELPVAVDVLVVDGALSRADVSSMLTANADGLSV